MRIKDVTFLERKDFDFGEPSEEVKEVRIITKKEEISTHLFIDGEFQSLLAKYIPSARARELSRSVNLAI